MPSAANGRRRKIAALQRRLEYLREQVREDPRKTFAMQEATAIKWALGIISERYDEKGKQRAEVTSGKA